MDSLFFYGYCIFLGTTLFVSSLIGKIEILKKLSLVGLIIIVYMIVVFLVLLPTFYKNYESRIQVNLISLNSNFFMTAGICLYVFANQYTVIPICNNLKRIKSKRITQVIRSTDLLCLFIYASITLIGYFSMPDDVVGSDDERKWELFLIRPSIDG